MTEELLADEGEIEIVPTRGQRPFHPEGVGRGREGGGKSTKPRYNLDLGGGYVPPVVSKDALSPAETQSQSHRTSDGTAHATAL